MSLPVAYSPYSDKPEGWHCPVCLDDAEESIVAHDGGGKTHPIHQACLTQWIQTRNECPSCRAKIGDVSQIIPLWNRWWTSGKRAGKQLTDWTWDFFTRPANQILMATPGMALSPVLQWHPWAAASFALAAYATNRVVSSLDKRTPEIQQRSYDSASKVISLIKEGALDTPELGERVLELKASFAQVNLFPEQRGEIESKLNSPEMQDVSCGAKELQDRIVSLQKAETYLRYYRLAAAIGACHQIWAFFQ